MCKNNLMGEILKKTLIDAMEHGNEVVCITTNGYQMKGTIKRFDDDCIVIITKSGDKVFEDHAMIRNLSTVRVPVK